MVGQVIWVAADWGTTRLRLWLMGADGGVIARRSSHRGMGTLGRADFEPALLSLLGDMLPETGAVPVVCCGMVGARQGWAEAPYRPVPGPACAAGSAVAVPCADPRLRVHILPGMAQGDPADVMRGEETQIAGLLCDAPDFDGVICLPGTHSKWARVGAGHVRCFTTFMTGEIFALLAERSVLRHMLGAADVWADSAFADGLDAALADPGGLTRHLFGIRAAGLLHDLPGPAARARLSGLLIGTEIAAAADMRGAREVAIIGAEGIAAAYRAALLHCGARVRVVDADLATLGGLRAAYHSIEKDRI